MRSFDPSCFSSGLKKPPVWPLQWNATLIKIGPETQPQQITWVKFYYDWVKQGNRFDFYDSYLNLQAEWNNSFTILFKNSTIYHIYPIAQNCSIRSRSIGLISPYWLQQTSYVTSLEFRGMWCDLFQFTDGSGMLYYQRVESEMPVRSTNQAEDPGATDYVDVQYGPQADSLFDVPSYCPE
jgi:hypothetical protein